MMVSSPESTTTGSPYRQHTVRPDVHTLGNHRDARAARKHGRTLPHAYHVHTYLCLCVWQTCFAYFLLDSFFCYFNFKNTFDFLRMRLLRRHLHLHQRLFVIYDSRVVFVLWLCFTAILCQLYLVIISSSEFHYDFCIIVNVTDRPTDPQVVAKVPQFSGVIRR